MSRELSPSAEQLESVPSEIQDGLELSYDFFTNKKSYGAFSLTKDHNRIIGCIDPRDPIDVAPGDHKIVIQTAGGAAGEGVDAALYITSENNNRPFDIETAIERDKNVRGIIVLGAHHDCKFIKGMPAVLGEMSNPSDFTLDSANRWASFFHHKEDFDRIMPKLMESAGVMKDYLDEQGRLEELVEHIDSMRPYHSNVKRLMGDNNSKVYVTNFHPHVGYNRNAKPKNPTKSANIQGYHDSLAASIGDVSKSHFMEDEERKMRVASIILRSAATRSVLTKDVPETRFIEVMPSNKGLKFNEVV